MKFINESRLDIEQEKRWGGIPENTEMDKLIPMLCKNDIPFDLTINNGRPQIWYPSYENCVCDVICHWGSYGHELGLLEIMGLVSDATEDHVEGHLSAEEVFERIKNHYVPSLLNKELNLKEERCFESIGIYWFKTSEQLPDGYNEDSENPVFCYGAYFDDAGECFVRDDLRYNTDDKIWEWLFEAGYDYWEETKAPDFWAYQVMPTGPEVI